MRKVIDLNFKKVCLRDSVDIENPSWKMEGFIYLIKNGKKVKIGSSTSPIFRISGLLPLAGITRCEIYVSNKVKDYKLIEKYLHFEFRDKRAIGEWFYVSPDDVLNNYSKVLIRSKKGYVTIIEKLTVQQGVAK